MVRPGFRPFREPRRDWTPRLVGTPPLPPLGGADRPRPGGAPDAVVRREARVCIDALQRRPWRAAAHVGQEALVIVGPFGTDGDAVGSGGPVAGRGRVAATVLHGLPGAIGGVVAFGGAISVNQQPCGADLAVAAPTARGVARPHPARIDRNHRPAVAHEVPMGVPARPPVRIGDPEQPAVAHAGHVDEHAAAHLCGLPRAAAPVGRGPPDRGED